MILALSLYNFNKVGHACIEVTLHHDDVAVATTTQAFARPSTNIAGGDVTHPLL